jgi:hypothetical protein
MHSISIYRLCMYICGNFANKLPMYRHQQGNKFGDSLFFVFVCPLYSNIKLPLRTSSKYKYIIISFHFAVMPVKAIGLPRQYLRSTFIVEAIKKGFIAAFIFMMGTVFFLLLYFLYQLWCVFFSSHSNSKVLTIQTTIKKVYFTILSGAVLCWAG